ncbi:MAG TPA: hypothetical protein VIM34_04815 [Burkholderiaceae bacterium]
MTLADYLLGVLNAPGAGRKISEGLSAHAQAIAVISAVGWSGIQ